ncbi:MAG: winged helix-turn-helix transcriptional regulator [Candidatus Methanoperedens sp.]|nr:winged helix-turn-helix transcriptional regulator [Candidatus Methanoperedens sp.]MCZ7370692.1 winged helix-turn-helix transcriptional regulator [Candidatus Methanoperedens sp.]
MSKNLKTAMPEKKQIKLDEIDKSIIALLQEEGRMQDIEIAKKLGISDDTSKRRRKRLDEMGYLKVKAMLNPWKFGFTSVFFMGIMLVPGTDVRNVAKKLSKIDEFFFVSLSLGPTHSIVATARAKDQLKLNNLVEELKQWSEIERIDVNIIYEVIKSGYHFIPAEKL